MFFEVYDVIVWFIIEYGLCMCDDILIWYCKMFYNGLDFFLLGVFGVWFILFSYLFSIDFIGSDSYSFLFECEEVWIVFFFLNRGCIEICVKIEIENWYDGSLRLMCIYEFNLVFL